MKKVSLFFVAFAFSFASFAQAVADNAVIPVSVNINSILRLNVSSGGNIEFSFVTVEQYTNGIANDDLTLGGAYDTQFTVASSVPFTVNLGAEDASFFGADNVANTMALTYVRYDVAVHGTGVPGTAYTAPADASVTYIPLSQSENIVVSNGAAGAGNTSQNAFTIQWDCGVGSSLLGQAITPDRYSTNVFLTLTTP